MSRVLSVTRAVGAKSTISRSWRRQVAAIAQAQGHSVQIGVVAGHALDLQAENPPAADRFALVGRDREQRLPAVVQSRAGRDHLLAQRGARGELLRAGLDAGPGRAGISALATK